VSVFFLSILTGPRRRRDQGSFLRALHAFRALIWIATDPVGKIGKIDDFVCLTSQLVGYH
jgi:hypothetical protein